MIQEVLQDYPAQPRNVYLTGRGQDATDAWEIASRHPDLFAVVLPVGGAGSPLQAAALKDLPVWVFHGVHDPAAAATRAVIEALKVAGPTAAKYTEYSQNEQVLLDNVWGNAEVLEWLFARSNRWETGQQAIVKEDAVRLPKAVVNAVRNLLLIATLAATTGMAGQSDQRESYLCSWYAYYWNPTVVINGQSKDYRQEDYGPDVVNELACRFMERNKAEPFFCITRSRCRTIRSCRLRIPASQNPRFGDNPEKQGLKGTPDMFKKGDPKYYGDMVTYMDKLIDRLLARLDELGLRNNTLVLFTGDNGSPVGEALLHDRKVRAGKGQVTDAGTHVPLIASWPVVIRRGTVCTDLVDFSDFLPTLCEAAGEEVPRNSSSTDGVSFPSYAANSATRGHGVTAGTPSIQPSRRPRNGPEPSVTSCIVPASFMT